MSPRYSLVEARSSLPRLIDEAEAGIEVELTRHGRPVAVLVSRREFDRLQGNRTHFADAYNAFIAKHALKNVGVDRNFAASARDRGRGRKVAL